MQPERIDGSSASGAPEWIDGGLETAALATEPPPREPATEPDADPSWRVL
jgi:hypothetical protein